MAYVRKTRDIWCIDTNHFRLVLTTYDASEGKWVG